MLSEPVETAKQCLTVSGARLTWPSSSYYGHIQHSPGNAAGEAREFVKSLWEGVIPRRQPYRCVGEYWGTALSRAKVDCELTD